MSTLDAKGPEDTRGARTRRQRLLAALLAPSPPPALLWASLVLLGLEYGLNVGRYPWVLHGAVILHVVVAVMTTIMITAQAIDAARAARSVRAMLAERWGELLVASLIVAGAVAGVPRFIGAVAALRNLWRFGRNLATKSVAERLFNALVARPSGLLVASFGWLIGVGTLALMAPAATQDGNGASLLTALFTATSATCVTGLTVVDTGTTFARFGQWVILALIQLGGLGIMTVTTALALTFGTRMSARMRGAMHEIMDETTVTGFRRLIIGIVTVTALCEVVGTLMLLPRFTHDAAGMALSADDRVFYAAFHAISAFCNAGFGLYPDNLVRFAQNLPVNAVIGALVVLGGLGFPVLMELARPVLLRDPRRWLRTLTLHTRLAVFTSALLIALGAVVFLFGEWSGALAPLSAPARFMAAVFHSVSFRTAGFNSVSFADLAPSTLAVGIALMFVGGSPSGTAGGIKTTTLSVLLLALRTMVLQRRDVEAYARTIDKVNVYRAVAVTMISALALFVVTVFLLVVESDKLFEQVVFEAVSAFATVGLSTGITPQLSVAGKLAVIVLMFLGRIGTFSIALAVGERDDADYAYPQARVIVG